MFRSLFMLGTCLCLSALSFAQTEQTLSIIKPDGVANKHIGDIVAKFEDSGLQVAAMKMVKLTPEQAGEFYAVHKERPFYKDLVEYMTTGPVVLMVLEGDDAVAKNRAIMGATDPKKAAAGTIRAEFAESMTKNSVHGSDSLENAKKEIDFFFKSGEIVNSNEQKQAVKS